MLIIFPVVNSVLSPTFATSSFNLGIIVPFGIPIKAILGDTKDLFNTLAIAQSE
ncbi:alkanesulfonate monooxygenase [Clostridium botulinum]|uniref:Alkanesulfonate monooxygenase n=1 Tax=Clostridium botulinum TaxID=1491 RepID=A0A9Q4TMB6_CLOBO|nr:alkanesulfonate monooxygenase [Clostridium novyi]NFO25322.1 alkanesulfonate monooxygenase [Clostridium botulinum]NFQ99096.1 alkanesulfonate monooxygenase [Clostridium botulinum]NFU58585.1 alkanesulfonate monooxygenase [Clostridium botulinum]NFU61029.1 alkanesulfonate monooxygenase [Clostridium botulinum]